MSYYDELDDNDFEDYDPDEPDDYPVCPECGSGDVTMLDGMFSGEAEFICDACGEIFTDEEEEDD